MADGFCASSLLLAFLHVFFSSRAHESNAVQFGVWQNEMNRYHLAFEWFQRVFKITWDARVPPARWLCDKIAPDSRSPIERVTFAHAGNRTRAVATTTTCASQLSSYKSHDTALQIQLQLRRRATCALRNCQRNGGHSRHMRSVIAESLQSSIVAVN